MICIIEARGIESGIGTMGIDTSSATGNEKLTSVSESWSVSWKEITKGKSAVRQYNLPEEIFFSIFIQSKNVRAANAI